MKNLILIFVLMFSANVSAVESLNGVMFDGKVEIANSTIFYGVHFIAPSGQKSYFLSRDDQNVCKLLGFETGKYVSEYVSGDAWVAILERASGRFIRLDYLKDYRNANPTMIINSMTNVTCHGRKLPWSCPENQD